VRIVVPTPPGGGTDIATRTVATKLRDVLGQQFIIENRPGMAGNIGAEAVMRAAPDGYTLLAAIASHASNPAVQKNVPYDLVRDFAPISRTVTLSNVLIAHPSLPPRTLRELIAFAKARPGQLQYASAGVGSMPHLMVELLASMAGIKLENVPYKGGAPAFNDVLAGHVPLMAYGPDVSLPHIVAGRLRAYGVTGAKRISAAPQIPTLAEAGVAGYEAVQWFGLLAPAGTPREVITTLHRAVVQTLEDPAIRDTFVRNGAEPAPSRSPEEFGALIRAEVAKWATVVKRAGIVAQ
jgi:tripartite-type tricarboxylate transporter receptor subunit TctC